jgi:hypothetical protein
MGGLWRTAETGITWHDGATMTQDCYYSDSTETRRWLVSRGIWPPSLSGLPPSCPLAPQMCMTTPSCLRCCG